MPEVFTLYPEDPPTQLALRVDNIPPRVELQLSTFVVGTQFAVRWIASDGADIRQMEVEYDAGSGWTGGTAGASAALASG